MTADRTFVIVGAGLAGAKAAETLRGEGFEGRILLIGSETERPYERPPLSKGLLLGTADRDEPFVHPESWYAENNVELRTGVTVTEIDPAAHTVRTADGETIGYDKLLLATGASPRTIPVQGVDRALTLRTYPDSDRIAAQVREGTKLVVIGAGWIGLEVAAAARERGAQVTIVESASLPLQRVLGDQMASVFAKIHREHGVDFRFDAQIEEITADRVRLAGGEELDADEVILAVGVAPNVGLATDAGLAVDNGVLVDARLRTSDPDIFAAGDIAAVDHPLLHTRVRVEHWANALNGGPVAAKSMLGQDAEQDFLPYFFTDQYDLGMEYAGWVAADAKPEVVIRGDLDGREFIAFWTQDGKVLAGMNVNVWDVSDQIQDLIRAGLKGTTVDAARLADPEVPLDGLLS
ncbi:FAD-dependent oxidoreductase [Actinoplanes sp. NPDC051411]|uniref:NAD(P)/FAD-dependent oxidoreductase n=1 Tax=Actinoplanes sp. NPDC051411 TaxID=3155522 RepID=UPI00344527F0